MLIYPPIFVDFSLIFHQMALIFPQVPIVFILSSFEYSPGRWKCSVPAFWKWSHFRRCLSQCPIIVHNRLLIFLLLTFYWHCYKALYCLPMGKLSYNDKLHVQTLWQIFHCLVYAELLMQCGQLNCRLSYLSLFDGVTGNDGFCTKSFPTKHQHAQFVIVRQFAHWSALPSSKHCQ